MNLCHEDTLEDAFVRRLDLLDRYVRDGLIVDYEIERRLDQVHFLIKVVKPLDRAMINF